ncbi:gamma-glutamyl hydrolase-like [Hyla sarda]|uniref:gamma-glutamyl hydrolase-like n=1 Tax=Hyla sarda TaxID=327740 RepID=UPI0024C39074|nr:gamma-glutamyl hydrolase-like [Hyla sarda]XP_056426896.1 gamma-glutamyl hydrolase-like [Hyla sarda]XP_056426897.1 gamma-glutamyl hydrolase-like [Hyla sarda]
MRGSLLTMPPVHLYLLSFTLLYPVVQGVNDRPIIGIITQEVSDEVFLQYGKTYIADSYVKFLESAGSRVVPIRLNLSEDEYVHLFNSINGVLLPGGAVNLLNSSFYGTAEIFYKLAIEASFSGIYFPIWGTCMGFQILTALTSGKDLLCNTAANNISLPLILTDDVSSSKMFRHAPLELLHAVAKENITANFHHFGITPETFHANEKLSAFYHILSTNYDRHGMEFVSTMEARDYPIYGVQWHPEVNRFQWRSDSAYPHSIHAVWISQYMANFFVNEARKNTNYFLNPKEEESALIYTWPLTYTANISGYEQVYFFD